MKQAQRMGQELSAVLSQNATRQRRRDLVSDARAGVSSQDRAARRESRGHERDRRRCLCRRGMVPERLARLYLFVINLRLRKYFSTSP
jgi:hypothetical protein